MIGRRRRGEPPLNERLRALAELVERGEGRLDPDALAFARHVGLKADERLVHGTAHTVAAMLGATGSGKSSLVNALSNTEVATTGVRRPTTSSSLGLLWGDDDPSALLDWLEVPNRHQVGSTTPLDGLVLLDVPDHDSVAVAHRLEMERIAEHTDLMVWVTDPEKYADEALHHYLRFLGAHEAVMVVVLNKVDRLTPDDAAACISDLRRLLADGGLASVPVLGVSATTGAGLDELRSSLVDAVAAKDRVLQRLEADLSAAVDELAADLDDRTVADKLPKGLEADLADGLVAAAGIEPVAEAAAAGYRRDAKRATGWPFTRWASSLRPHPLRRLHLDAGSTGRSSLPGPTGATSARLDAVARDAADRATASLSPPWPELVRAAAMHDPEGLALELDRAVADATRTRAASRPRWWSVFGALQILAAVAAVVGFGWLTAMFVVEWMQLPSLPTPDVEGVPVPTALFVGGIVLGLLVALLARPFIGVGAKRRAATTRRDAADGVRSVAERHILAPMTEELTEHDAIVDAVARARGAGT